MCFDVSTAKSTMECPFEIPSRSPEGTVRKASSKGFLTLKRKGKSKQHENGFLPAKAPNMEKQIKKKEPPSNGVQKS